MALIIIEQSKGTKCYQTDEIPIHWLDDDRSMWLRGCLGCEDLCRPQHVTCLSCNNKLIHFSINKVVRIVGHGAKHAEFPTPEERVTLTAPTIAKLLYSKIGNVRKSTEVISLKKNMSKFQKIIKKMFENGTAQQLKNTKEFSRVYDVIAVRPAGASFRYQLKKKEYKSAVGFQKSSSEVKYLVRGLEKVAAITCHSFSDHPVLDDGFRETATDQLYACCVNRSSDQFCLYQTTDSLRMINSSLAIMSKIWSQLVTFYINAQTLSVRKDPIGLIPPPVLTSQNHPKRTLQCLMDINLHYEIGLGFLNYEFPTLVLPISDVKQSNVRNSARMGDRDSLAGIGGDNETEKWPMMRDGHGKSISKVRKGTTIEELPATSATLTASRQTLSIIKHWHHFCQPCIPRTISALDPRVYRKHSHRSYSRIALHETFNLKLKMIC
ncbi:hypothetical protein WN51_11384 [Melipona quadrifasciata]|uniref:Uncharacterized protein n=1 Tax=Melipona quadrifasciata TaxID=166423 RepID=A0A0N0U758_9HYME|nr:hypothetical protein WN51_11384 [Melipona quadrifasciata]